jgi:hypothetical protein
VYSLVLKIETLILALNWSIVSVLA